MTASVVAVMTSVAVPVSVVRGSRFVASVLKGASSVAASPVLG